MFQPDAYKITADPYVAFNFLAHRKKLAALAAEEKAKKAKKKNQKPNSRKAPRTESDDDDEEDDDDDDDNEDEDEDDADNDEDDGRGGGRGGGGGVGGRLGPVPGDEWNLGRREIYDCLGSLLMTKRVFPDGANCKYMAMWSVSRSQLPF